MTTLTPWTDMAVTKMLPQLQAGLEEQIAKGSFPAHGRDVVKAVYLQGMLEHAKLMDMEVDSTEVLKSFASAVANLLLSLACTHSDRSKLHSALLASTLLGQVQFFMQHHLDTTEPHTIEVDEVAGGAA